MESLPAEIQDNILNFLNENSLACLSLCNHAHHQMSLPYLYRTLKIKLGSYEADSPSMKMMRTFQEVPQRYRLLKHMLIVSNDKKGWTAQPSLELVSLTINNILVRSPLRSFKWDVECEKSLMVKILRFLPHNISRLHLHGRSIDHRIRFHQVSELCCKEIASLANLEWVTWHVQHNNLKRLDVSLKSTSLRMSTLRPNEYLPKILGTPDQTRTLVHLSLCRFDLSSWPPIGLTSLQSVELQRCTRPHMAFQMLPRCYPCRLRKLSLQMCVEESKLISFLNLLSQKTTLTHLRLLLWDCRNPLPINHVLRFRHSLCHLVLECWEAQAQSKILPYSREKFANLIESCTELKTLGIFVELGRSSRLFWVGMSAFYVKHLY